MLTVAVVTVAAVLVAWALRHPRRARLDEVTPGADRALRARYAGKYGRPMP